MVKFISLDTQQKHYNPPQFEGLEMILKLPDGEIKPNGIPNSSVWIFNSFAPYRPEIHGGDTGCGMTAFAIEKVDVPDAIEQLYTKLNGTGIIGRGNHFIDILSHIDGLEENLGTNYQILLLHTHGLKNSPCSSLKEAFERQKYASEFRKETGGDIAKTLGVSFEIISDMPHNTVYYEDGFTVYRKGAVRCNSDNIYFLPAHLGAKVMAYTINDTLPMQTMPHGTGRSMPRSEIKELAMQRDIDYLKSIVYLPKNMNDSSLKDMIPEAFNNYDQIIRNMLLNPEYDKMFLMMGSSKIEGSLFKL